MPRTELQPPPLPPSVSLHPPLDFVPCPLCAPPLPQNPECGGGQHPAKCQGGALTASAMEQALTARLLPLALCHCPGTASLPARGTGHSSGRLLCSPWPQQPPSSALQEFLLLLFLCCSELPGVPASNFTRIGEVGSPHTTSQPGEVREKQCCGGRTQQRYICRWGEDGQGLEHPQHPCAQSCLGQRAGFGAALQLWPSAPSRIR